MHQGLDPSSHDMVLREMRKVVHGPHDTERATALGKPRIEMGDKTGTSQVRRMTAAERAMGAQRRKKMEIPWIERDHALFVCFAPYHDPRYAVSVIVEHGKGGSTAAGPIARDIMRKTLELYPPSGELQQAATAAVGEPT